MLNLDTIRKEKNLTDFLKAKEDGEVELRKIGNYVVNGYQIDEESRSEWKDTVDKAMEIAKQVQDTKNFPWPNASNIKFPLITKAAIEYASRVLPELLPSDRVVKVGTVGKDLGERKNDRADRVERAMSYQLISSPDWYASTDSLLSILPVVGTVFKKTYYSVTEKRNISEVCPPDKLVVNYSTKTIDSARRVTHLITLSLNDIIERQRRGLFDDDIKVESLRPESVSSDEEDYEIELLEQHCWYDLDDDGYKEPYVITVHEPTKQVLRIVSRIKRVEKNDKKEVVQITPWQYFTDFHFIRSPDGGFYSMGFGQLLLPINKAINSLINQLIDAGTLSTTQGGFIGKGLRLKAGDYRFKPFEWKVLDAGAGTDIKDSIFPFPVRDPSPTLLSLLTLMIDIGDQLTSSTEATSGTSPSQNVSSQTLNQMVEQGSKIFVAINQRFFRSQTKEYQKLYELNYYFLDNNEYANILDEVKSDVKADFELASNDILPVADPSLSSQYQRVQKAQLLMGLQTADPRAVDMYILKTLQMDEDQIQALLPPKDPNEPPPPELIKLMAEAEAASAKAANLQAQTQMAAIKLPYDQSFVEQQVAESRARVEEGMARVWKMQKDAEHGDQKVMIAGGKMQSQETLKQKVAEFDAYKDGKEFELSKQELDLKETEIATKAILENKKLDIMAHKEANAAKREDNKPKGDKA